MSDTQLYGEDLHFADQLKSQLERLVEFRKRERSHPEDALVLEPSSGWHRYLVHQAVQMFPSLASFSVGEGAKRRPVVCFSSKFNLNLTGEETVESKDERRPHRRLYVPPASRSGPNSSNTPDLRSKKNIDERLQLFEESQDENLMFGESSIARVPELNPHAATFVPFSTDLMSNASFHPPLQQQTTFIRSQLANRMVNDISNATSPCFNSIQDNHFNPEAQPFVPFISNGIENISIYEGVHQNGNAAVGGALGSLDKNASAATSALNEPTNALRAASPTPPPTSLSKYINTYQEFVPSKIVVTPRKNHESETKTKKRPNSAYVPPHLRGKKDSPPREEEKPPVQLTADQLDRIKNQEKKEKAMAERARLEVDSEKSRNSQSRSGYASFKNQKPNRRNRRNSEGRFDLRDDIDSREYVHLSDNMSDSSGDEMIDWAEDTIDQTVIDEISSAVPGLKIKRSYDIVIPAHMLEIFDFPTAIRTQDLLKAFTNHYSGFSVRWVDDTHALAIFASKNQCQTALARGGCGQFRVRDLVYASEESRKKAALVAREQRCDADLEPATRPETSVVVARRLIAANVDTKIAKQIRAAVEEEKLIKGCADTPGKDEPRRRSKGKAKKQT